MLTASIPLLLHFPGLACTTLHSWQWDLVCKRSATQGPRKRNLSTNQLPKYWGTLHWSVESKTEPLEGTSRTHFSSRAPNHIFQTTQPWLNWLISSWLMQSVDTEPAKACLKALEVASTGKGSWPAGSPPHGVPLQPGLLEGSEESSCKGTRENDLQGLEIEEIRQEIMSIWKEPVEQHPALCWGSYLQHNPNCVEILILFTLPWKTWESLLVNPDQKAACHHRVA